MANKTSLTVELDANTRKLDTKLNTTDKKLDQLSKTTDKADSSLAKMSKGATIAGNGITAVGGAAVTATATVLALSKVVGNYAKELKIASQLSGEAVENLQNMAFATSTVGIGIEKLGDISKDTREKVGDFLNTGGGGFMDFVDAMKLTKKQAKETAEEFAHMSGTEILQEMVKRMEDANVSAVQMSHALEGMASDTTNLIPLLSDNSSELNRLSDSMKAVTVPLTDEDIDLFVRMGESTDIATAAIKNLTEKALLDMGEQMIKATDAIGFFFASLNEGTEAAKTTRLAEISDEIKSLESAMENAKTVGGRLWNTITFNTSQEGFNQEKINALLEERVKIQKDLAKSRFGIGEENDSKEKKTTGGGLKNNPAIEALKQLYKSEEELLTEKYNKEVELAAGNEELLFKIKEKYKAKLDQLNESASISAIEDRFKTEEQLLTEKLERELLLVGENKELRLSLEQEYLDKLFEMEEAAEHRAMQAKKKKDDLVAKKLAESNKVDKDNKKKQEGYEKAAVSTSLQLAGQLFEGKKEIGAGLIVAETAQNVVTSVKNAGGIPWGIPAGLSAAALGVAQLSALKGASKGGGSISASGASAPPAQVPESDGLATIDISSGSPSGTSSTEIRFAEDSGNDLADAIAAALNKGQQEGRYS